MTDRAYEICRRFIDDLSAEVPDPQMAALLIGAIFLGVCGNRKENAVLVIETLNEKCPADGTRGEIEWVA